MATSITTLLQSIQHNTGNVILSEITDLDLRAPLHLM